MVRNRRPGDRLIAPLLFALVTLLATAFACSTVSTRIHEHQAEFDALPHDAQEMIRSHEVAPGFDEDMVYMALGRPAKVNTTQVDGHVSTKWTYTTPVAVAPLGSPPPGFASPYEYPVIGPGPSRPYPMFYGERTRTIEFEDGRVSGESRGGSTEPAQK